MVAGQEACQAPVHLTADTSDPAQPRLDSTKSHKIAHFKRKFANRVWTSPAYKQARQQERFEPPQVLLLDTSGDLGLRCKALANAIPFLEPSPQPSEHESGLILQCLWSRSIIAVIAALPAIAQDSETAVSILQAIKASAALAILTVPRDHVFLQSQETRGMPTRLRLSHVPKPSPGGCGASLYQNACLALPGLATSGS